MLRKAVLWTLHLGSLAAVGALWLWGRDYYALELIDRPRHPLHWQLKPGGEIGRLYGIGGAALMLAMLSYSVRKRVPWLRRTGRLALWLDFHIWCGVTGPLLIFLHSAGKVGGLIAISFWSMVAVALSGILGRFLYAQIPRTAAGDQVSLEEAQRIGADLDATLRRELGSVADQLPGLDGADVDDRSTSLVGALVGLAVEPLRTRRRLDRFRARHSAVRALPRATWRRLGRAAGQRALLRRRIQLWQRIHELFHYWHVFHKPFALLMYLFAAVHIGVAFATGYALGAR